jgi:UDP-N-acetylglucosamine acyltransferase
MGSAVSKDIPAFVRVSGNPAIPRGLNVIGIQRLDLGKDQSSLLKKFYKLVYLRKLKLDQAISEIEKEVSDFDAGKLFLDSIQSSDRGIVR